MEKRLNILLFGPPGAGKGTQAEKIVERYGLNHISTGEVIRSEIRNGTELGKSMEAYIGRGELAPDKLVVDMVADYVSRHKDNAGNIYDGFPRTKVQAEEFDKIMSHNGIELDLMLSLEVPDSILIDRLLLRGKDSGRADDMNEDVIKNRLDIYKDVTEIVSSHYKEQGKYVGIDGTGTVEEIFGRICSALERHI